MSDLFENSHVHGAVYFTDQGHFLVKLKKKDGGSSVKNVREADLTSAFTHSSKDSGWLPNGIMRVGNTTHGPWFVYVEGPKMRKIRLDKIGEFTIPAPTILFFGSNGKYQIFVSAETKVSADSLLYQAPFPNVNDGTICWGNNQQPKAVPGKAPAALELFFQAPFSNHWANGKSKEFKDDIRERLKLIDGAEQYPVKDLVSCNLTVGRLVDQIIRGRN